MSTEVEQNPVLLESRESTPSVPASDSNRGIRFELRRYCRIVRIPYGVKKRRGNFFIMPETYAMCSRRTRMTATPASIGHSLRLNRLMPISSRLMITSENLDMLSRNRVSQFQALMEILRVQHGSVLMVVSCSFTSRPQQYQVISNLQ